MHGIHIPVAKNGNTDSWIFFDLADECPIRFSFVHLNAGTPVNSQSLNSDILQPLSHFQNVFSAERISPSEEINSVYMRSAPPALQTMRKGGSLTSSIGAKSKGKSPSSMLRILTIQVSLR